MNDFRQMSKYEYLNVRPHQMYDNTQTTWLHEFILFEFQNIQRVCCLLYSLCIAQSVYVVTSLCAAITYLQAFYLILSQENG